MNIINIVGNSNSAILLLYLKIRIINSIIFEKLNCDTFNSMHLGSK